MSEISVNHFFVVGSTSETIGAAGGGTGGTSSVTCFTCRCAIVPVVTACTHTSVYYFLSDGDTGGTLGGGRA